MRKTGKAERRNGGTTGIVVPPSPVTRSGMGLSLKLSLALFFASICVRSDEKLAGRGHMAVVPAEAFREHSRSLVQSSPRFAAVPFDQEVSARLAAHSTHISTCWTRTAVTVPSA